MTRTWSRPNGNSGVAGSLRQIQMWVPDDALVHQLTLRRVTLQRICEVKPTYCTQAVAIYRT